MVYNRAQKQLRLMGKVRCQDKEKRVLEAEELEVGIILQNFLLDHPGAQQLEQKAHGIAQSPHTGLAVVDIGILRDAGEQVMLRYGVSVARSNFSVCLVQY